MKKYVLTKTLFGFISVLEIFVDKTMCCKLGNIHSYLYIHSFFLIRFIVHTQHVMLINDSLIFTNVEHNQGKRRKEQESPDTSQRKVEPVLKLVTAVK